MDQQSRVSPRCPPLPLEAAGQGSFRGLMLPGR